MNDSEQGQVSRSAAEVYDEFFVPALFQEWAGRVADAARIERGEKVLDVACGTGVLTRTVAERVGASGSAVGLDVNEGMLAVARAKSPGLEWRQAPAESLPFEDGTFDAVVSQFGLMFFADRIRALREMRRVLRPGGRLAIAVWASLMESPGYAAMAELLRELFGDAAARALHAPFALGEADELRSLFAAAGLGGIE
ncbi:MAG: class I SAM-dependent methyltransferase, partial [Candidatus Binatia bacterium]